MRLSIEAIIVLIFFNSSCSSLKITDFNENFNEGKRRYRAVQYKRVDDCGGEGIRLSTAGKNDTCYFFVNEKMRCAENIKQIPIATTTRLDVKHPKPFNETVKGVPLYRMSLKKILKPGMTITVTGTVWYEYKIDEAKKPEREVAVAVVGKYKPFVVSQNFANSLIKATYIMPWDRKNSGFRIVNHTQVKYGSRFQIDIVTMSYSCKIFADGLFKFDIPMDFDDVKADHVDILGIIAVEDVIEGEVADVKKNIDEAEAYCQKQFNGHLMIYDNKEEKKLAHEAIAKCPKYSSGFEIYAAKVTQDGIVLRFDRADRSFLISEIGAAVAVLKPNQCLIQEKHAILPTNFKAGTVSPFSVNVVEITHGHNCSMPLPVFGCKSAYSDAIGLVLKRRPTTTTTTVSTQKTTHVNDVALESMNDDMVDPNKSLNWILWIAIGVGIVVLIFFISSALYLMIGGRSAVIQTEQPVYDTPTTLYTTSSDPNQKEAVVIHRGSASEEEDF